MCIIIIEKKATSRKPCLICNTIAKLLEIKSFFDLSDIWAILPKNLTLLDKNIVQKASQNADLIIFLYETVFKILSKMMAF